jgi:uncharacterized protein (TIGR02231 family)
MRILPLLIFVFSWMAMWGSLYGQTTTTVSSTVSGVTVYPNRARITRTGNVNLPIGQTVLQFSGLPAALEEGSVIVSAQSETAVTIEGIDLREEFLASSAMPKTQDLERQLEQLQDQKKSLQSEKSVAEEKRNFFRNLSAGLGKGEKETTNLDDVRKLYTFYGEEVSNLAENILSLDRAEAKLEPEINRIKRELEALKNAGQKSERTLLVSVNAAAAAKADFTVRYLIGNAYWNPIYDARVDSGTGKVELLYNALVRQETGEDWNNVRLVLSTAQPGRNGRMPELSPDFVDFKAPEPVALPKDEIAASPPAPAPSEQFRSKTLSVESTDAQADVQKNGLAVAYQVELPVTIPADGQTHRTNVSLLHLTGSPEYVTTPKLDSEVFLKLHLVNTSEALLLPGPVSVFRDAEFTGTIQMDLVPSGSDFDLYVGKDDSIKVERNELVNKRSETGLLNRRTVVDRKYQTSLQNFRSNPIKILIYDQLPVSRNADIVVSQGVFSDQPAAFEKDSGKLSWNIVLPPKVKKVIEYSYSIEWPKGKEIMSGL